MVTKIMMITMMTDNASDGVRVGEDPQRSWAMHDDDVDGDGDGGGGDGSDIFIVGRSDGMAWLWKTGADNPFLVFEDERIVIVI